MPVLNQAGQRASSAQVKALELAHKKQFNNLINAWGLYHAAYRSMYLPNGQYNPNSQYTPTKLNAWAQKLIPITAKWVARQKRLESIPNSNTQFTPVLSNQSFVTPAGYAVLKAARDRMEAPAQTNGIGFIPLIIWAIIAIVAALTAVEVTDELNNTSQEQAQLINETNNFCSSQNLTPEQCNALLQQQTESVNEGSGFGSALKWIAWGGVAFVAVKYVLPEIKSYGKKQAA